MNNQQVLEVDCHKHLGLYISNNGSWHQQINFILERAWCRINIMRKLKFKLDRKSLEIINTAFIRPILEYSDVIWDNCAQYEKNEFEKNPIRGSKNSNRYHKIISINTLYKETGWDTFEKRRKNHKLTLFFKMSTNVSPSYLSSLVPQSVDHASSYNLRKSHNLRPIATRTNFYYNSFLPSVIRDWNELPVVVRQLDSVCSLYRQPGITNLTYTFTNKLYLIK